MTQMWPALLMFLTVVIGLVGIYSLVVDLWLRDRTRLFQRVDEEFLRHQRERARNASPLFKDLSRMAAEVAATEEPRPGLEARIALLLDQAGLDRTPRELLHATWLAGVLVAILGVVVLQSVWAAPPGFLVGMMVPTWYVFWQRRRRLDRLTVQLPNAFENMARILRAGHTLMQAMQVIVRDFEQPLAGEFAYCHEQQKLGLSPEVSFQDLARRVDLFELRIFAVAMAVQQQTGGNIAELLDRLASGARDRRMAQLRLKALTAESRLQANVLLALPLVVFAILWVLRRTYAEALLDQPRLLVGMLLSQLIGALWIRSIVSSDD